MNYHRPLPKAPKVALPHSAGLTDSLLLDDNPQLASVAVLQTALPIAAAALDAHHGDWGICAIPEGATAAQDYVLLLASLIHSRCLELAHLLGVYRSAVASADEPSDDEPF